MVDTLHSLTYNFVGETPKATVKPLPKPVKIIQCNTTVQRDDIIIALLLIIIDVTFCPGLSNIVGTSIFNPILPTWSSGLRKKIASPLKEVCLDSPISSDEDLEYVDGKPFYVSS